MMLSVIICTKDCDRDYDRVNETSFDNEIHTSSKIASAEDD